MNGPSPDSGPPLKVLVLGMLRPPHVSEQAIGLAERGFEVHVAGDIEPGWDRSGMDEAGIPVTVSPGFRRNTPRGMRGLVRWIDSLIAEIGPDVVNAHWIPGYCFATALTGYRALASTAWGSDIYKANGAQNMASRYALRRSRAVMADSRDLLNCCVKLGINGARTEVVNWGVDLDLFRPAEEGERAAIKERLGLGAGPVILSPRSIMPVYNVPEIVEAFDVVAGEVPDAQLVIKHMGNQSVELPSTAYPDRVRLIGRVPYEEMADYYRIADLCVSVPSSDSSPRSVWEAMASGAPCVLSDLRWVDELITRGQDAATVPAKDALALAATLRNLLADPGKREEMGRRGHELAVRHMGRGAQMDLLADVLRSAADVGSRNV